jgi:hypothetical protein
VEAVFHAGVGLLGVHPVRRGDDGRGQVFLFGQHFPVIFVNIRILSVFS